MKYTLLELTQDVLSSMDSDEINSITDTVESQQVVKIIKAVYDDIISRSDLGSHQVLFTLTPSGDGTKPTMMFKPDNIDRILNVRYNAVVDGDTDPVWRDVHFAPVADFISYTQNYTPSEDDVGTFTHVTDDGYSLTFHYKTDNAPQYFTTIDDKTLIFDSYDIEVDSTLQASKTLCTGSKKSTFIEEDTWTPELQPQQFQLLLSEAKVLAWAELKQMPHSKAEQMARRNWRHLQKTRQTVIDPTFKTGNSTFDKINNFARRR